MQPWLLTSVQRASRVFKLHLFHAIEPLSLHTEARKPAELPVEQRTKFELKRAAQLRRLTQA
jgi:hypothetical protein